MPDVDFFYDESLRAEPQYFISDTRQSDFRRKIKPHIALKMDCENGDGLYIPHEPEQIIFTSFALLPEVATDLAIVRISAYDWPDRMKDIDDRLRSIGRAIKELLEFGLEDTVSLSFICVPCGLPASAYPDQPLPGGWVRV